MRPILFFIAMIIGTGANAAGGGQSCIQLQGEYTPFGEVNRSVLRRSMPSLRYIINADHLSIDSGYDNYSALRQEMVPTNIGTDRVVAAMNIKGQRTYTLSQSVLFEDGFDWGGVRESGKFGFGLGGGSAPSGGQMRDDGLSARLMWSGNGDGTARLGVYAYSADRSQNLPWGDVYGANNFLIPVGTWFRVTMELTANSSHNASDGSLKVLVDGDVVIDRKGIQWQRSGGRPVVEELMYSTFYGGSSSEWSPDYTTHVRFSNVCLTGS